MKIKIISRQEEAHQCDTDIGEHEIEERCRNSAVAVIDRHYACAKCAVYAYPLLDMEAEEVEWGNMGETCGSGNLLHGNPLSEDLLRQIREGKVAMTA